MKSLSLLKLKICMAGLLLGLLLGGILSLIFSSVALLVIGLILFVLSAAAYMIFCKCPHCGSRKILQHARLRAGTSFYCPSCGRQVTME